METLKIGEGINLHVVDVKKFKTATMLVLFRQPLSRSTATKKSLISNILRSGTQRHDSVSKLNAVVDSMYGSVFESQIVKKGEEQILQLYIDLLCIDMSDGRGLFEQSVSLLKEVIFNPLISEQIPNRKEFERSVLDNQKKHLKKIIEGRKNNRAEYAKLRCIEEMFCNEPFGVYGDGYADDIDAITAYSLYDEYNRIIKSNLVEIMLICDRDNICIKNAESLFDGAVREDTLEISKPEFKRTVSEVKRIDEYLGGAQGKLCLGYRAQVDPSGELFYPLMVANEILGGGSNSKLFKTVREQENLCYSINSSLYRFKSALLVQTGVEIKNFEKVIDLTNDCVSELKTGAILDDELANAKKTLKNLFSGLCDHPSAIADFYLTQYMMSDESDVIEKIEAVSAKSVREACEAVTLDTIYTLA